MSYVIAKSEQQWIAQARAAVQAMADKGFDNVEEAGDDPIVGELVEAWYALGQNVDHKLVQRWLRPADELIEGRAVYRTSPALIVLDED